MSRYVVARIEASPGEEALLTTLIEALAQDVRSEAGNRRFEVYAETAAPGRLTILEEYADEAAFAAHLQMPHTRAFNEKLKGIARDGASEVIDLTPIAE
ncbi:MAG: antibiotic biosynthesis monooxygenase [Rhodobacteraceae bacterium]|uniref:putative quinol monooxygenase n=1 Tax=Amaricoccus sp. B4 TaxID=3368557 RepID=UPI000DAEC078|nr:antibiotic biosynthesis monooxygenase [Paracoccaceae bacterium]